MLSLNSDKTGMFVIGLSGLNQLNDNLVLTLDDGVKQCKDSVKKPWHTFDQNLAFFSYQREVEKMAFFSVHVRASAPKL